MHIGFDISQTGADKAGCGYFAHAMIQAMLEVAPKHRYALFPNFGDFYFDETMPVNNPYPGSDVHYGPRLSPRESSREFWTATDTEVRLGVPDIVHSNNFWCPTQFASSRLIYTFYDMGFTVDPTWSTEANRVGCFNGIFRSAIMADWVVAISNASRAHYLSVFPHFPLDRIRVIHPCSRFAGTAGQGKRPEALKNIPAEGYWLSVGTIEPRKNQRLLVDAYARYLAQGGPAMPLVLAGGSGWLMEDFHEYLDEVGVAANVLMTGYVSDDELVWLYRNCYANLYPSLFEGFGLPVLEGMQFGAPTLASDSTSLPEVAGEAAILLAPDDLEGWVQALLSLSTNKRERNRLGAAALARAEQFDWKRSAIALLTLYEDALASPKRGSAT